MAFGRERSVVRKPHLPCGMEGEVENLSSGALSHSLSRSSGSKDKSDFIGISPSFIDWCSASMSSSVRCGGFSTALMRRCAAAFFFWVPVSALI